MGFLSIGGTLGTFTFPLEIKNAKVTTTKLNSTNDTKGASNTGGLHIFTWRDLVMLLQIVLLFLEMRARRLSPVVGCAVNFGILLKIILVLSFLGDADITDNNPDNADLNNGTLNNTTVYISEKGGITSQNTALAFGHIKGRTAGSPTTTIIGSYNITNSATITSGGILTVSFTKDLTSANYTVIATGLYR